MIQARARRSLRQHAALRCMGTAACTARGLAVIGGALWFLSLSSSHRSAESGRCC